MLRYRAAHDYSRLNASLLLARDCRYAFTPWSGFFEAGLPGSSNGGAIWTNAHSGQFSEPGWRFLSVNSGGSGWLSQGGSYVTMVSGTDTNDSKVPQFTLVLEKLHGRCLRCAGQNTTDENVQVNLQGPLASHQTLQLWISNATDHFMSLGNISVPVNGTVEVEVPADSIVTLSSWFNGQQKGVAVVPPASAFPSTLADDFESYKVDGLARFFAANGGSFQVAEDPLNASTNKVLKQWVTRENGINGWGRNVRSFCLGECLYCWMDSQALS